MGVPPSASAVPASRNGIPNAPLQPASGFIEAIADRFQERHIPPLPRERALLMALVTMRDCETDCGPINHPDFDWSLNGAQAIADEVISYWEPSDGVA